jgi:Tfp pilus assembly protein PilP
MRSVMTLVLGMLLVAAGACVHAQAQPAAVPKAGSASVAAGQSAKPAAAAAPKSGKRKPAKSSVSAPANVAPVGAPGKATRRDPFESLVGRQKADADAAKNLPPGKAGLQISTLRLDGIVRSPNGMIAVVSNPQGRTYFLRDGDQLYDGRVEKIGMDGVAFHETGKDAFGKPVERQVNKRIYSSAGEQQ